MILSFRIVTKWHPEENDAYVQVTILNMNFSGKNHNIYHIYLKNEVLVANLTVIYCYQEMVEVSLNTSFPVLK